MKHIKIILLLLLLPLLLMSSVYSINVNDNNNRAYYKLENLSDTTGRTGSLTNNGATSGAVGIIDNAYNFDSASSEYMNLATNLIPATDDFTINVWFNMSVTGTGKTLVGQNSGAGGRWLFYVSSSDTLVFQYAATQLITSTTTFGVNDYYMATLKREGANFSLYVNGDMEDTATDSISLDTDDTYIGKWGASGAVYWNGDIDEMSFWNTTLDNTEIEFLYNNGTPNSLQQYPYEDATPTIQTNLSSVYSVGDFSLSFNTVSNVNMSVYLDGTLLFQRNNTNSTTYDFSGIDIGNHNLSSLSVDSNGYEWNNQSYEVQPYQYFRFFNGSDYLTNYTFGGISSNGTYVTLDGRTLSYGDNTLSFVKSGYSSTDFTFTFNNTAQINTTYNVNVTTIFTYIYDRDTGLRITDNVDLELIGTSGDNSSTTTGNYNFSGINMVNGDYQMIATSSNYGTEIRYFTFNNQESITLNFYMINSTEAGTINILVKDNLGNFIESAIVNLLEWKVSENAYVSVGQCETNSAGVCQLNIELNTKLYKFQASKSGQSVTSIAQIITTDSTTLTLTIIDETLTVVEDLPNLSYSFTENVTNNVSLTRLEWTDTDGLVSQACINAYRLNGYSKVLLGQNCTSSSTGILYKYTNINNTDDISCNAYL